jgi:uncharacterized protein
MKTYFYFKAEAYYIINHGGGPVKEGGHPLRLVGMILNGVCVSRVRSSSQAKTSRGGLNMAKMSKEIMDVFNDPGSAKVLATAGATALEVNAAPKGSLRAVSEDVIAFADIFGDKTNKNLQLNKKVSALAFKVSPVAGYQVKGTFLGFQTSGELFDRFAKEVKEKIKLDIRGVGTIRVDEVYAVAPPEPGKKIA